MNTQKITNVTCGILFKKSFGLMDMWGSLVDQIVYKNSYFSPEYFPNISSQYTLQGELSNNETGHYLRLTTDNLVYKHVIQSDFEKEYKQFCERISKYLIDEIIFKNGLDVRRLGIVYTYELSKDEAEKITAKYFKPGIKGISDFRFSRKEPTSTGGLISGNTDFINKIYTVGAIDKNKVGITYDYQLHYNPPRECVIDKIERFLSNGYDAFEKDIASEV